nr:reverse transcriptase domain-containing protein [Tanacetum cinerariifolium]
MIQQVQNICQFHGLPGDDANKHLDKFLTITQSMKENGVTDDALRLYLFLYSLTHHATAWFDRLSKNSIHTFQEMASNWGTFMKRIPKECYDLIDNMTAHHNDWDTSAHRGESSSSTTSSSSEIAVLAQQMIEMRKDMLQIYRSNQQVNSERPQGALPSNTKPNPRENIKAITTRSGIVLDGPSVPPPLSSSKESPLAPAYSKIPPSHVSTSSELPKRNTHQPPIPYPSSLAEALALMPKYHKMLKDLLFDKEKLLGLANTSLTENCSAVLLKKLPEKLICNEYVKNGQNKAKQTKPSTEIE